jgi:glycosyltransferase involved in cell wall biosynthesis
MRIAAFGFRSIPLRAGCAGADKFALELLSRLADRGHEVVGYNRLYEGQEPLSPALGPLQLKYFRTVKKKGFDTLLHSTLCTLDIIVRNTGDVVHIQNGGNGIFAFILRLFGKKVFISQDGKDWKRDKWPWYGKLFLKMSSYITATAATQVIFDNIFAKREFESKFSRQFEFIPFGSEVSEEHLDSSVLEEFGLERGRYFLFVGRFIPDKGLQYLIPAFKNVSTDMKLVLVGGSPNPSDFEASIRNTDDKRIVFPGFLYGSKVHALMKNAYCYVQPSDVEGLSPVILENMGLGTPVLCSDIKENKYIVGDTGLLFRQGDVDHCREVLQLAVSEPLLLRSLGERGKSRARSMFSWDVVTTAHERVFMELPSGSLING